MVFGGDKTCVCVNHVCVLDFLCVNRGGCMNHRLRDFPQLLLPQCRAVLSPSPRSLLRRWLMRRRW